MMNNKNYNKKSTLVFGIWALIIHFVLLWGILDINFHSPIIQGLPVVPTLKNAPAKRLILFVADGLRFRTFIENPPPYLKNIMKNEGIWGISNTHMPTESRPGNIAITAGFYEDPSAIFKGWKENSINFDSVFNQSYLTWAWGSPDIISIFTKDNNKGNIDGKSYPADWQDFNVLKNDTFRLDSWVFDKYIEWLQNEAAIIKDVNGIIIFLHLLGCDTIGHARKPFSREYVQNMNYVDKRVEEIIKITENTFGNGSTAYLFTSDHGMTDWGSHGSGSIDETKTPLIAWGAGVSSLGIRHDVEQADITPLISTLIGIPIPINNEGILPRQYLNSNNEMYNSLALLNNLKQLTYQVKGNRILSYTNSESYTDWREIELYKKIFKINEYLENGNTQSGIQEAEKAITLAKEYLLYFRQYQRNQFLIFLSLMWCSWITLLFFRIIGIVQKFMPFKSLYIDVTFACVLIIILVKYAVLNTINWRQSFYGFFTVISLWLAVQSIITFRPKYVILDKQKSYVEIGGTIFLLFIMFIGLTFRSFFSIGMLFSTCLQKILIKNAHNFLLWTGLILTIFPLLPVVEPYPRIYIVLVSICVMILGVILRKQSIVQKMMEVIRLILTGLVYLKLIDGRYWISWIILATIPLCIWTYNKDIRDRLEGIIFGLFCPFVLLSASYEPFFFLTLAVHLLYWPPISTKAIRSNNNVLNTEDFLNAAYFMLYTLLCFFGTGNMASISSFDPSWTQHFITIFSPFIMCSLILFKLSIPLMLIGCASHIFGSHILFFAVLLLADCLSLPLIYHVTPEGSWLDIGSAISRFVIAITLPCLLLFLHYFSQPLMRLNLKQFQYGIHSKKNHIV